MQYFAPGSPILMPDDHMVGFLSRFFPAHVPIVPEQLYGCFDPTRFDGILLAPSCSQTQGYDRWLKEVCRVCRSVLEAHDYQLDCHVGDEPTWKRDIVLAPEAALVGSELPICKPVLFQLGGRFVDVSADAERPLILARNERYLEPGLALLAVTMLIERGVEIFSMRIECPGAGYSPGSDGRFADVLRIDVRPPTRWCKRGYVQLDWNWGRRTRPLHGCGSAIIIG